MCPGAAAVLLCKAKRGWESLTSAMKACGGNRMKGFAGFWACLVRKGHAEYSTFNFITVSTDFTAASGNDKRAQSLPCSSVILTLSQLHTLRLCVRTCKDSSASVLKSEMLFDLLRPKKHDEWCNELPGKNGDQQKSQPRWRRASRLRVGFRLWLLWSLLWDETLRFRSDTPHGNFTPVYVKQ